MIVKTTTTFETSWAALKAAASDGKISMMLRNRDQIPVALKNGESVVFEVSYDADGKLWFVLRDCLNDEHCMNKKWTNEGGWAACDMRRHANETIFALLPDDLQAVIAPTKIVQVIDGERVECEDKLFALSMTQVFGKGPWSEREPEDAHLDIFAKERDRVKECGDYGTWLWWLRSPDSTSSATFRHVNYSGNAYSYGATYANGVVLGFSL